MKKSKLSFKCVVPDKLSLVQLEAALMAKNLIKNIHGDASFYCFLAYSKGMVMTNNAGIFCSCDEPLMNYEDAIRLVRSIEPDAPEFDIKLRDEVLVRHSGHHQFWLLADFAAYRRKHFSVKGGNIYYTLIKYEGNEHFHGTTDTPDGWWECENGKPVWKTK